MLLIDVQSLETDKDNERPLYPYNSVEFVVIFVYGNDFRRQKYRIFNQSEAAIGTAILGFLLSAAAVLCYVRRSRHLRRDDYISSFIDVGISFFGGGNLRMNHKLER